MELVRDAQRGGRMNGPNGTMTEALTTTERTQATAQAALQPFSYDLHVKLGMEVGAGDAGEWAPGAPCYAGTCWLGLHTCVYSTV